MNEKTYWINDNNNTEYLKHRKTDRKSFWIYNSN